MSRDRLCLLPILLWTLAAGVITLSDASSSPLYRLLVLPLVLFFPGYSLTAAIFPSPQTRYADPFPPQDRSDPVLRFVLVTGTQISVLIVQGLLLHLTPLGITDRTSTLLLAGITLLSGTAALFRSPGQKNHPSARLTVQIRPRIVLYGTLAILLVLAAFILAARGMQQSISPDLTRLWILPVEGAGGGQFQVHIRSLEQHPQQYRLQVWASGRLVEEWPSINLSPGESWSAGIIISPEASAQVEALLFRAGSGSIYRRVHHVLP